jgi:hypothetical protein
MAQSPGRVAGPSKRLRPAKVAFELQEAELDWVKLWAIRWEIDQFYTCLLAEPGDFLAVMYARVVHDKYRIDCRIMVHARKLKPKHRNCQHKIINC